MLTLLGIDNPHGGEPLYPWPERCSGWRLWRMTGLPKGEYLQIRRTNIKDFGDRHEFRRILRAGDVVVVLGDEARRYLDLPKRLIHPVLVEGVEYRQVPHPSGRTLFYNDPVCKRIVEVLLRCLIERERTESSQSVPASPRRSRN